MSSITIKNRLKEIRLFKNRLILVGLFIVGLSLFFICRLFYLQISQHQHFETLSRQNKIAIHPLVPRRGIIYDRNGVILADNIPVFSLIVTPQEVPSLQKTLQDLQQVITLNTDNMNQFNIALSHHRRFEEIPLKLQLSPLDVARFSLDRYKFPGISVKAQLMRSYPFAGALAHVLGYVGRINTEELNKVDPTNYAATHFIGKLGIERYFENELHGKVGYEEVEIDARGQVLRTMQQKLPESGRDLYLTMDSHLQLAALQALGEARGSVIVLQPKTGEILALVSQPTYDSNLFVEGMNSTVFQKLQHEKSRPLYNRAIQGLYAPGSTIKPFIAFHALNWGLITPQFTIYDPGWYQPPGTEHVYHNWEPLGHGLVNIEKAITYSCDTYFYHLANQLGIDRLVRSLTLFGFGQKTGIEMEEEIEGLVPSPLWKQQKRGKPWYLGDTIVMGIGQGYLQVTPFQLAVATSIIANRGTYVAPHLLYATHTPSQGQVLVQPKSAPILSLQNKGAWATVIRGMSQVTVSGTGYLFGQAPYSVAAKTGTAQVVNILHGKKHLEDIPEHLRHNSLFIAFAPIESPEIAIAVVIENNNIAPAIARKVMDYYFEHREESP